MKKIFTAMMAILLFAVLTFPGTSNASVQVPQKVRIGLFYEETAVSSFNASSDVTMQLGYVKDNMFTPLYEEPAGSAITIRKDSYFIRNGSTFTEYDPQNAAPSGEIYGPFHVKLGSGYNDYALAKLQADSMKQKGLEAYPAYADSWQVWTGNYQDQNAAQADIINITAKIGSGTYDIINSSNSRIAIVSNAGEGLFMFDSTAAHFLISAKGGGSTGAVKINNKSYRGDIEVRRFTGSDMTVINTLSLDCYLYGVVPSEIESYSKPEALKAQAVAARTYALNSLGKHVKWDFDLCTTTACQVYKGMDGEAASTNKAVDDTSGKKITYNGKPAQVFYYAASGGKTEDPVNVWGNSVPYLKSVDDKYETKHREWNVSLSAAKIREMLKAKGYDIGDIVNVDITKTAPSGRVTGLLITGSNSSKAYTLDSCRNVFNLNSQWYTISTDADIYIKSKDSNSAKSRVYGKKVMTASGIQTVGTPNAVIIGAENAKKSIPSIPTTYRLSGKGWGHGIGMSQEGAKGMADSGFKYDEIIEYYFPGTKVE